jgi:hypothetical protein
LSGKASCSARFAEATSIFFLRISLKETGNRKDPRYIRIRGINDSVISGEHCTWPLDGWLHCRYCQSRWTGNEFVQMILQIMIIIIMIVNITESPS